MSFFHDTEQISFLLSCLQNTFLGMTLSIDGLSHVLEQLGSSIFRGV